MERFTFLRQEQGLPALAAIFGLSNEGASYYPDSFPYPDGFRLSLMAFSST